MSLINIDGEFIYSTLRSYNRYSLSDKLERLIENMQERKKLVFINIVGIIASIGLLFSIFLEIKLSIMIEIVFGYSLWIYLLITYISWINEFQKCITKKVIYILDFVIQLCIFALFCFNRMYNYKNDLEHTIVSIIIILLILTELFIHNNFLIIENKSKTNTDSLKKAEIVKYIQDALINFFHNTKVNQSIDENQAKRIQIAVYNALAIMLILISYLLKYILEIVNFNTIKYTFPHTFIVIYIILFFLFCFVEIILNIKIGNSKLKTIFIIISCTLGMYLFVFRQYGNLDIRIIICTVYLVSPFILECANIVQKYQLNHNL